MDCPEEVHVWSVDLDPFAPGLPDVLSADERERADKLLRPIHRSRFINGRGALRLVLGRYVGADPATLRFASGSFGKPNLPEHAGFYFNVSHSEHVMLIAVTGVGEVGVDVEMRRAMPDQEDIVQRFFQADEIAEYKALPSSLRTEGFFNGWTRKEAILKARGDGLSTALDSFSVSLDPRQPCRIREFLALPERREDWSLLAFEPRAQFTAALAVRAPSVRLVHCRFDAGSLVTCPLWSAQ